MDSTTTSNMAENLFTVFRKIHSILSNSEDVMKNSLMRSHYEVLFVVNDHKIIQMSEIARLLSFSKPYMTALIDKLIEEELVERVLDKKDRRIINIKLTTKGEMVLSQHNKMIEDLIMRKFIKFEEYELEILSETIDKLKEMLCKAI